MARLFIQVITMRGFAWAQDHIKFGWESGSSYCKQVKIFICTSNPTGFAKIRLLCLRGGEGARGILFEITRRTWSRHRPNSVHILIIKGMLVKWEKEM